MFKIYYDNYKYIKLGWLIRLIIRIEIAIQELQAAG